MFQYNVGIYPWEQQKLDIPLESKYINVARNFEETLIDFEQPNKKETTSRTSLNRIVFTCRTQKCRFTSELVTSGRIRYEEEKIEQNSESMEVFLVRHATNMPDHLNTSHLKDILSIFHEHKPEQYAHFNEYMNIQNLRYKSCYDQTAFDVDLLDRDEYIGNPHNLIFNTRKVNDIKALFRHYQLQYKEDSHEDNFDRVVEKLKSMRRTLDLSDEQRIIEEFTTLNSVRYYYRQVEEDETIVQQMADIHKDKVYATVYDIPNTLRPPH